MKIPNKIEAIADLKGELLREKGNKKITGQQGCIPLIFIQSGEEMIRIGKKNGMKKINIFLLFLNIIS